MRNTLFLSLLFLLFSTFSFAQRNYDTAIGARLGYPLSVSAKKYISDQGAIEGYLGFRGFSTYNWVSLSGAYLHHDDLEIDELPNLSWYFGGGASAYFWRYRSSFISDSGGTSFGLQGYLGLEYTFEDVPLNLTIDWIPSLFFNGFFSGFGGGYGSLGVRYVLE